MSGTLSRTLPLNERVSGFQYHFDWHIFISHYLHLVNALSFNSLKWFSLPSFCVCFLAAVTIKVTTELKWHWSDELMHLSISPSMVINRISATLSRKRQPSKGRKKTHHQRYCAWVAFGTLHFYWKFIEFSSHICSQLCMQSVIWKHGKRSSAKVAETIAAPKSKWWNISTFICG